MSSADRLRVSHILSNPSAGGIEGMLSELVPRVDLARCDMGGVDLNPN